MFAEAKRLREEFAMSGVKTIRIQPDGSISGEVGTTGPCGGDTGYGGRLYFSLVPDASADVRFEIKEDTSIEFLLGGDWETMGLIIALEELVQKLKEFKSIHSYINTPY